MKASARAHKLTEEQVKNIESFLNIAKKAAYKLHSAMFGASDYAPTRERYVEMVRGLAETDYPHWRERMNWSFRAIRDVLATPTVKRRAAQRRARPARRQTRKVAS